MYKKHKKGREKLFYNLPTGKNIYYYLELVIPLQAESPQGKTSELLRHPSDQATINTHSKN